MMGDVILHEGHHRVIGMVVALLHAQVQRLAGGLAGLLEEVRVQLALQELVARAWSIRMWEVRLPDFTNSVASHSFQLALSGPR